MQNIYETFEFDRIKEALKEYAKSEVAFNAIDELKMASSFNDTYELLEDLKEVMSIIIRFSTFPISNSADALNLIAIAKKTGLLSPHDLNLIMKDIETMNDLKEYIKKVDVSYPRTFLQLSKFQDLSTLYQQIKRVITPSLTIDDKASVNLHQIRTSIRKVERTLENKAASLAYTYSQYLSDDNPTIRDGHFVLPVKTVYKSKVLGAIYDISDTGNTVFIEPLEIISLNNEITSLKVEEAEEIRRILKELTSLVLLQEDEIINNNQIIGEIDFLQAKALYAQASNSEIANFTKEEVIIDLINARHPLLDPSKVVSNSYHFDENKRIVIISGPNAGGKTVSLKTVGLLVLMNQCGLALPANKATLSYFNHIYVDIGDNQSLSDNLSTFSAHMSHIGEITSIAKAKDLVLFDELGTGTDPKEGEAIALGVIKSLIKSHTVAFISSHFSHLKEFALTHENLENSCMIFDEDNLKPTYIFKMGIPGKSYGIEVASRYGIKSEILDEAKEFIKANNDQVSDELIMTLQHKVEEASKIESEVKKMQIELENERKRLKIDADNLKNKRDHLLESVNTEKANMINEAKEQIDDIIKSLSNSNLKLNEVIELKHKLEALEEDEDIETFSDQIEVNDNVEVPYLGVDGVVKRIKGDKAFIYTNTGLSLDIDLNKCRKIIKITKKNVNHTKNRVELDTRSVPIELNIIGLHVDEAKEKLVRYIDDCRLKHMSRVRIIHGFGSGALRKMTHEYLKLQKDLSYSLADGHEGGGGATVVKFNER